MSEFKTVIGVLLILISIITFGSTYEQYYEAELYGAITVFVILSLIGLGLIYHGQKRGLKIKKVYSERDDKIASLKDLKKKKLITEQEYNQKLQKVTNTSFINIEETVDYSKLKNLYNSNILTKQEFDEKVNQAKLSLEKDITTIKDSVLYVHYVKENFNFKVGSYSEFKLEFTNNKSTRYYQQINGGKYFVKNSSGGIIPFDTEIECQKYLIVTDK